MTSTPSVRIGPTMAMLGVGGALTLILAVLPLTPYFRGLQGDHVREGYPSLRLEDVDAAVTAYVVILGVTGGLGLIGWCVAIWAARKRAGATRWVMALFLTAGAVLTVAALSIRDTSGDIGVAPLFGWLLVVPCLVGVAALASWQRPS